MDGQGLRSNSTASSSTASNHSPPASSDRSFVEGFLSRLFQDRFLSTASPTNISPTSSTNISPTTTNISPTTTTSTPAPPRANNLVPFFAAHTVFAPPPTLDTRPPTLDTRPPTLDTRPLDTRPLDTRPLDTRPLDTRPHTPHTPHSLAPMQMQPPDHVVFCVEDTVGLRHDKYSVGVVDRSFNDVDTHEPRPQRDYGEDIERHPDVPLADFHKFMRTGIPPRGSVLVSWQTQLKTELIPEQHLQLLDRALYVGDVVKRRAEHHMSGTVIGTTAVCTLFPATHFHAGHITQATTDDLSIRNIPANELLNVHEFVEGAIVVYGDWVGRIENVYDEVAIKLSNNSVVVVENPAELEHDEITVERLSVGDSVRTKKGNLRRGLWRYGAFDPNIKPEGMVVETRPIEIDVQWLARSIGAQDTHFAADEPPANLGRDEFESPTFFRYDASAGAASTLPLVSSSETERTYHVTDVAVGDRVRFKDLSAAAVKYDGTHTLPNGYPQGKVSRLPRTETLGYDMNVFLVMQTHTQVTVQWQDLTITQDVSSSLIPDPNVEDDDEVWPAEIVCSKEDKSTHTDEQVGQFMKEPAKVGVVQDVKSRDRIARVRWFKNHDIKFFGADLLRPATTGDLSDTAHDVSLYDIYSSPALTRRRGDFVLVHPQSLPTDFPSTGPNWFGEVVDLGLDGKVTIRLGAAKPVVDIHVVYEDVTLAYSTDMDNEFLNAQELDGDSIEDSDEDVSDFDSASFNDMWIEYEGMEGEPPVGDEEDWSTEDEEDIEDDDDDDDDDDTSMPDLEPVDGVDTSKTTPDPAASSDAPDTAHDAVDTDTPAPFLILDTPPPSTHHYIHNTTSSSSTFMRRIAKEHKILRTSLPPNIFVRTWDSRLDLIRVLIIGPSDTPYEYAPFVIDFHLPSSYPQSPPEAFFHSWTAGSGPVNPNLYEDGKICLSLLGTWHTDERNESWSPAKSTLLQVLVSIMGLVLVKDPYYNEAGYDVQRAAPETRLSSALYTERAYFRARAFIHHALSSRVEPFEHELEFLYRSDAEGAPRLLDKAIEAARDVVGRSLANEDEGERDGLRTVSLGAVVMLRRQVESLESLRRR